MLVHVEFSISSLSQKALMLPRRALSRDGTVRRTGPNFWAGLVWSGERPVKDRTFWKFDPWSSRKVSIASIASIGSIGHRSIESIASIGSIGHRSICHYPTAQEQFGDDDDEARAGEGDPYKVDEAYSSEDEGEGVIGIDQTDNPRSQCGDGDEAADNRTSLQRAILLGLLELLG